MTKTATLLKKIQSLPEGEPFSVGMLHEIVQCPPFEERCQRWSSPDI